jgi:hypothetical protein
VDWSVDAIIFWMGVGARVLVPLGVFRFPLPAMLAALVIDGLDQAVFQTITSLPLEGYQSYDKALDVYYLSMAYLAMHRNWVSRPAFDVGRFLYGPLYEARFAAGPLPYPGPSRQAGAGVAGAG